MNRINTFLNDRMNAPFRADIVGSFLRPDFLKEARGKFASGAITETELEQIENEAIAALVQKQREIGLEMSTDGEFRRSYWHLDFFWGLNGVEHNMLRHGYMFHGEETRADSARLCGKVAFNPNHPFLRHFNFLKSLTAKGIVARQTIPAPAQFYAELMRGENALATNRLYPDKEALAADICEAYRQTILAFYDLGCRNLQIDDCTWGMLCDKRFRETMANGAYDAEELQRFYLRLNNCAIANLPEDMVVNTHVCRGNYHSTWATTGGYDAVARNLFAKENVNAFYLEFDSERAGGFEPLANVPENKMVVLGLVTTKQPDLEDKDAIIRRIEEATQYVPLERLCLSPQCGFASTEEGNILTEQEQWAKIELVQEIAGLVW